MKKIRVKYSIQLYARIQEELLVMGEKPLFHGHRRCWGLGLLIWRRATDIGDDGRGERKYTSLDANKGGVVWPLWGGLSEVGFECRHGFMT